MLEAAHQRERWGSSHDGGKAPLDWFWLIGYLAQKAATSQIAGDADKAKHHTISTAAALANWHAAINGDSTAMRPGIEPPTQVAEQSNTTLLSALGKARAALEEIRHGSFKRSVDEIAQSTLTELTALLTPSETDNGK